MKHHEKSRIIVLSLMIIMLGTSFAQVESTKTEAPRGAQRDRAFDGQILFSPFYGTTTYTINSSLAINHTWHSAYQPDAEAYWLGNGTILRPIISGGGGVQKILYDGTVAWDFRYNVAGCTCHHDVTYLPDGNVLLIVWETKTRNQAIQEGRNPLNIQGNTFTPDKIIEVKPTGPTSGDVVWEWHVWDHLIQDFDPSKDNYGVVGDHPDLIDINFGDDFVGDWLHTNSIDYDPQFDQLLIDIHNFNEAWVIDHSTTTEEAAGHTGGHYGHGGDLLYRWGNPQAYRAGTAADQQLFGQHDASWIKPGYPGAGHVLVFNNGLNRPSGQYSSVDEFAPPIDAEGNYYLEPGSAYGPEDLTWSYTADPPGSMYTNVFGGALRLKDGNTLICDGIPGEFFEVTPQKTIVWQWTNPYPNPTWNAVFTIDYIPLEEPPLPPKNPDLRCTGSLAWTDVKPGVTVHGSFQVRNSGDPDSLLNWTVNNTLTWGTWTFTPTTGRNLTPEQGNMTVQVDVVVPDQKDTEFQGFLQVQNRENASDFESIPVTLKTSAALILPSAHPLVSVMRHWLSLLPGFYGKTRLGHFIQFD